MKELAKRHRELIMKDQNEETEGYSRDFLKDFCATLEEINQTYQRILPFQSMFYEFTQNGYKKEYRAAVSLLRELAEENKEEGKAIEYLRGYWDLANRKVTFNQGRLNMKRYMSIMANRSLRMKYFGF